MLSCLEVEFLKNIQLPTSCLSRALCTTIVAQIQDNCRPMKGNPRQSWILDSALWIPEFKVLDSSICQQNLDSEFQSLVGFRISKPRISDSISKIFPDSGIRIPLHEVNNWGDIQINHLNYPQKNLSGNLI